MTSRWVTASVLCSAALAIGSARADTSIKGLVLNKEGKPVVGAEVRAERLDTSARRIVTRTDASGRYTFNNLPTGPYTITVLGENGAHSNPRTAYSSDNNQPARRFISAVPYQLRPDYDSRSSAKAKNGKPTKRYVWKPGGETGTHIGGQWIDASEAKRPTISPLETTEGGLNRSPSLRVNYRQ